MLGNSIFFNRTIRTITTAFGSLFANIVIARYNYSTNPWTEQERFLVKLLFGQKEKYIQVLTNDPTNSEKVQIALPIIAYNFLGLAYDSTRKGQTTLQNQNVNSSGQMVSQFAPVPYNFHYQVYVYVRNIIDGDQIIEQILPFFTPEYSLNINLVPAMNITQAVPFLLNSATYELLNEGENKSDTRYILWTLDFTAQAYLYGPVSSGSVIKEAMIGLSNWTDTDGSSLILLLNPNSGNGTFLPGETLYQGSSQVAANASAEVVSYSSGMNQITIAAAQGMFHTGTLVFGGTSGAYATVLNYNIIPQVEALIEVSVNPLTANASQPYTTNTHIIEFY